MGGSDRGASDRAASSERRADAHDRELRLAADHRLGRALQLKTELDGILAELDACLGDEVAAFSELVKSKEVPAVILSGN